MKIVFMGTPEFALKILESLHGAFGPPAAVVTQPDRPKGRGNAVVPSPVKVFALRNGIRVIQPEKPGDCATELISIAPDFIVVAAYGQILKKNILEIPSKACVNVHGSLLPRYRGASPINRAIMDGETITGITTMIMDEGMDTGDMLLKREVPILPEDTAETLHDRLASAGAELCVETLARFDSITPEKQDGSLATYTGKFTKEDGRIDWSLPAARIGNLVRGCTPWPGTFTFLNGKMLKIWKVECDTGTESSAAIPGAVIASGAEGITVATGEGRLVIKELQLEGKSRQAAGTFLMGFPVREGDVFSSHA